MKDSARNIAVLGSTGSIGRNSLEVIKGLPDRFRVTYLTANKNTDLLAQQIRIFKPRGVVVLDENRASALKNQMNGSVEFLTGVHGLKEVVRRDDVDIVISSLVGFAGLEPTIEAIRHHKTVALANKETLVAAGQLITALLREYGVQLIPIDSEHSAILQCLQGEDPARIARLILTASGGPFLNKPLQEFGSITVDQALHHPNWQMGRKITVDSATLMNKGLEVIEAHWLFGLPAQKIDVVIHPQSIIHSMVEFVDGSVKAQLGIPDMKLPIQYALTFPDRFPMNGERLSFPKLQSMTFSEPDRNKFRCLQLAYDALSRGGTLPAAMNAANEVAVEAFLTKRITFKRIPEVIENAMTTHKTISSPELPDIIEADRLTRQHAETLI
ncbi:MAG TPA: 1-deoxy-D-xylulose-5-phosphate reductoisomerase [Bacteroidota bacterium]|nr:1-deoxy-D-xylulose-5-phosphate reductoisomerase [Bacteroidota bacterium]